MYDAACEPRQRWFAVAIIVALAAMVGAFAISPALWAQEAGPEAISEAEKRAAEALAEPPAPADNAAADAANLPPPAVNEVNLLQLFVAGGWLMAPIVVMSLIVAIFGIERILGLRRRKVMPFELVDSLGKASGTSEGLDPRKVYKICQQFPSTASNVIRAAMLKVGRPHAEVEHAVKEASEREADRLYANVRPLTLAAAVTPLLGLLGTVWGMIIAFSKTASGAVHANKAEELAGGIYTALVTTFAGLAVAIPAAVLAHWLEGRIQTLFREIDELLLNMLPQLERYEGKLRIQRRGGKGETAANGAAKTESQPPVSAPD